MSLRTTQVGAEYSLTVSNVLRTTQVGVEYSYTELVQAHRIAAPLRDAIMNHLFRSASIVKPTGYAIALFTASPTETFPGTEVSGNGYARLAVSSGDANWNAPTSGSGIVSNAVDFVFPTPTGSGWGILAAWGLYDATVGGTLQAYSTFSVGIAVAGGSNPRFPAGVLTITFA